MTSEPINESGGHLADTLEHAEATIRKSLSEATQTLRKEGSDVLSCATDQIRKNPVPIVVSVLAVGVAIGYLIGRNSAMDEEDFISEPMDLCTHIGESVSASLSRLYSNLKFW